MNNSSSKLESTRQSGKTQVDAQRTRILDSAEKLFLKNGLEATRIIDIAAEAGITKMSLYRYFPNRDVIALEIQARMLQKISALVASDEVVVSLEEAKKLASLMIRNFEVLRDAYRYIGMFDSLYLDNPAESELVKRTKTWLSSLRWNETGFNDFSVDSIQENRLIMVLSTVIWFLEKLALRGELTWSSQAVPLEMHLQLFEEMITGYIDRFIEA